MSKSRRSLIRSSLQSLRQLWHRRDEGRREMRRCLGSTFEQLEPRLAMAITSVPPPIFDPNNVNNGAHIHPVLTLIENGHQIVIPPGVGLNSTASNPHTHDFTGTLHVGEGAPVGTDPSGSAPRNTTLEDFFNVWHSSTLTAAGAVNPNAIFDTSTSTVRFMDQTLDSQHVLRMYVQEAGIDAAPELEYDSNSPVSGGLAHPEDYVPRDGDQIIIDYEPIAQVAGAPSFDTIATQNVLGGAPTWLGINGIDPTGGPLTYSVQVSNPSLLTATFAPSTDKSLILTTASPALEGGYGQMTFHLFDSLEPNTTSHIEQLVTGGTFIVGGKFYRVARNGDGTDFVIQGGPANSASGLGQFDDEFNKDLQFTTPGLLAMAKGADDTNDSQVFITGQATRFLDMQHSIFGVLTEGEAVRQAIQHAPTHTDPVNNFPTPNNEIDFVNAQIVNDTQNAALMLKAAEGASGQSDVTITVTDAQNHTYSQTFHVNITPDTANSAPFLNPIAPVVGLAGQPITVQLSAQDVENDPNFFDAAKATGETANIVFNETQQITRNANGSVTFSFNGVSATPITLSATTTATDLQNDLSTIPALSGKVAVTGSAGGPFTVSFDSSLGDVAQITANNGNAAVTTLANANASLNVNHNTGLVTITPPAGFTGTFKLAMSVRGVTTTTTQDQFDTQNVTVSVLGAPTVNLAASSDTGTSSTDDITSASSLDFVVTGVTSGAIVKLMKGSTELTHGTATGSSITLNVPDASTALGQGVSAITATQSVGTQTSAASTALNVTFDSVAPSFTSAVPSSAPVGFDLNYDAQTNEEGAVGLTYSLSSAPTGATINPTTGVISWTPTAAQAGTQSFSVVARDAAGNTATQPVSVTVDTAQVDLTLTLTKPDGTALTTLNPGDNFVLHVFAKDLRANPQGVYAAYTDVTYDSTKVATNGAITYGTNYGNGPSGNIATAGLIDEAGAFTGSTSALPPGPLEVFKLTMKATAAGRVTFAMNPADLNPDHLVLLLGGTGNSTVPASQIHFASASIDVGIKAFDDSFNVSRNSTSNALNVLANDTGTTLRVISAGTGNHGGTITVGTNGANLIYTPANNFVGSETFTYTVSDKAAGTAGAQTSSATATVNVSGLIANDDSGTGFTVQEDSAATVIDPLANDTPDPNVTGSVLTITDKGAPDHGGTVTISSDSKKLNYTPAPNFQGTEKFTYTVSDGQGHTSLATVSMTVNNVNDAPTATADTLTAFKNTKATFDVLANDSSAPDPTETLTLDSITTAPQHGTANIVNGKVEYTPATDFTGADSFVYQIKDPGGLTSTATANITVSDFAPSTLSGFVYFDVNNNGIKDAGELAIAGVTITLTGTASAGSNTSVNLSAKTGDDGSYKFDSLAPGNYAIKQAQPLFLIDGKDTAGSQGGTVTNNTITIATLAQGTTGINNNFGERGRQLSTVSLRDFFSSTSQNFAHAAFDNAGNELWHTLSGAIWSGSTNTTFSLVSNKTQIKLDSTNAQSLSVSKTLDTTLPVYLSGKSGTSVLYYVPGGATSANSKTPVANADSFSTTEDTALPASASKNVLTNDTGGTGTLKAILVNQATKGTVSLSQDGTFTYTPNANANGTDTFTYKAADGNLQSAPATVTITITPVNDAPSFTVPSTTTSNEDAGAQSVSNFATSISAGGSDESSQTLTFTVSVGAKTGTLDFDVAPAIDSTGKLTYTAKPNTSGTATISVFLTDNGSSTAPNINASAAQTFTITVNPVNDAPVRTGTLTPVSVNEDSADTTAVSLGLSGISYAPGGSDESGQTPLTVKITAIPSFITLFKGDGTTAVTTASTLTVAELQQLMYKTVADTIGTGNLLWTVQDTGDTTNGGVNTLSETLAISVNAVNDAPVRSGTVSAISVAEDSANSTPTSLGLTGISYTNGGGSDELDQHLFFTLTSIPSFIKVFLNDGVTEVHANDPLQTIDDLKGLKYETIADANGTGSLSWTVKDSGGITNGGHDTLIETLGISVNAINDAPTFTMSGNPPAVNEDASAVTVPNFVTSFAPGGGADETTQTPTYHLEASDPTAFAVQPTVNANGTLSYTPAANANGTFTVGIFVTDSGSNIAPDSNTSLSQTFSITINPVNDAPLRTAGNPAPIAVNEDSADSVAVTLGLSALNYGSGGGADEAGQTRTYKLTSIPSFINVFQADGTTPVAVDQPLTLAELNGLTYKTILDANGTADLIWMVKDSGGTANGGVDTLTEHLSVTVFSAANDPPVRTAGNPLPIDVNEDSADSAAVTLGLSGLDYGPGGGADEATQGLTYKLTTIPSFINVFQSNGTTPVALNEVLTLPQLQTLTYKTLGNANGTANLIWSVQDSGGTAGGGNDTLSETLAVAVHAVNDVPVLTSAAPASIDVNEDSENAAAIPLGLSAVDYGNGGGSDEATQQLSYKLTTIPSFIAVFQADGATPVAVGDPLTLTQLQGLTYKTLANGAGSGIVSWTVKDDGLTANGGVDTLNQTLSVTVHAINDAPALTSSAPAAVNVDEDSATQTAASLGLNGLTYSPGGGADEAAQGLTVTVTAIPSFVSLFKSDGTTLVVVGNDLTPAELQGLTYKTLADANGTGNLTWTVHDDAGTANGGSDTLAQTLGMTVNAVNDAPARTAGNLDPVTAAEDDANDNAVTLGISTVDYGPGGGADEAGSQSLSYTITAIPSFVTIFKADGTTAVNVTDTLSLADLQGLTYKTIADANGTGNLTWVVQDTGGTANGGVDTLTENLTITVTAVNDMPSFTIASDPPAVNENDGQQTVSNFATNISAGPADEAAQQNLTFQVISTGGTGNVTFTIAPAIDSSGTLTYTLDPNTSGTATFSVKLSDDGNPPLTTDTQSFTITVNPAGGGEGEGAPLSMNDAALMSYLAGDQNSLEVPSGSWESAVDQLMRQLA